MSGIVLSAGVRQNLLSLQNTADLMSLTQNRLATGKKVNTALDNPTNYFTSAALQSRSKDLNALLDSMSNGIKTLEAGDNGISAINRTIESMQSTLRQARQDKSFKSTTYPVAIATPVGTEAVTFTGGAIGTSTVSVALTNSTGLVTGANYTNLDFNDGAGYETLGFSIAANGTTPARAISIVATDDTTLSVTVDGGAAQTYTVADSDAVTGVELSAALNAAFDAATNPVAITASLVGGQMVFTSDTAASSDVAAVAVTNVTTTDNAVLIANNFGYAAGGVASTNGHTVKSIDALVTAINSSTSPLYNKVRASNDNGKLRVENLSTADLVVGGVNSATGNVDGSAGTSTVGGNEVRINFVKQFNGFIDQLNKLADDASYNGVNLLRGDKLKITFNENGSSTIEIQAKDSSGNPTSINTNTLGITQAINAEFDSDTEIDNRLDVLTAALGALRSQASLFGSNLSVVQNRQDFTKAMMNTLQTGADNLVLADTNEEGANMLALQTRQQLSTTALSLANQASQAVLRLFG